MDFENPSSKGVFKVCKWDRHGFDCRTECCIHGRSKQIETPLIRIAANINHEKAMKGDDGVKEYIQKIPRDKRQVFKELHDIILAAAPEAESCISYSMPAVNLHGVVVYYACWENHMAIYPMPSAMKAFASSLDGHVTSKSTIRLPFGQRIPKKLIGDIVRFRISENREKAEARKHRKTAESRPPKPSVPKEGAGRKR